MIGACPTGNQQDQDALLVNDIKALASQFNERIIDAQKRGFKVSLKIESLWKTDETFVRERITVKVWQEVV